MKEPQLLPTERVRGLVEASLRLADRIPFLSSLLQPKQKITKSDEPVSLVIPLHPKDMWIAPYCLKFARRNLKHPLAEVLIISKDDLQVQAWVNQEGLRWIDESEVLGSVSSPSDIVLPEEAAGLESWVFQQLIKFAVDDLVTSECFLILDSDTLLLAPRVFKVKDELWQDFSHERNLLYLRGYEELLGRKAEKRISFVCHHMFGECRILGALKREIAEKSGENWEKSILNLVTSPIWTRKERMIRPFNFFSEYETYCNYARSFYRKIHLSYFRNHGAKEYNPISEFPDEYVRRLPRFFKWASFHSYYQYSGTNRVLKEMKFISTGKISRVHE